MNITYCDDYERLSVQAASLVISETAKRKNLLMCATSGSSPTGLYDELARKAEADKPFFDELRIIKLDEWGGIPENDLGSSEQYLRTRVLNPLGISPERYISFSSNPAAPADECERIRSELAQRGPIDVCLLGLGINGHLGFNEPGPSLKPHCHVAQLSEESRRHAMVRSMERKPEFGLTLGMQEILASRKIVLLVAGEGKEQAITGLLSGEVTTTLPASFLWLHDNVDCLIDRTVLADQEK
jgi:galactosamine-6-phosphate isomerase